MSIDKETVKKVARLARLKMSDSDLEKYAPELNSIIQWIDQLNQVDTDGVEPLSNITGTTPHQRQDIVSDGAMRDDVLKNTPETTEGFFVVPKVVE